MPDITPRRNKKADDGASKIYPYPQPPPQAEPHEPQTARYPRDRFDEEVSLYDLWCVVARQRRLVLSVMALSLLAALTYAWLSPDVYRAEVQMVYSLDGTQGSGAIGGDLQRLSTLVGVPGVKLDGGQASREVALATLKSRSFTDQFLKEEQATDALLAADGRIVATAGEQSPQWRAYKRFASQVRSVSVDRNSGVITLGIEWTDPQLAAQWANAMITRLNAYLQNEAVSEAEKSIAYLNEQLASTNVVELQQSIYRLIESQIKKIMVASVNDQYAFRVIDPAQVPEEPYRPRRMMIVILALLFGVMAGLLLAFLREYIARHRRMASDEGLPFT